jgi:hypothetical protein
MTVLKRVEKRQPFVFSVLGTKSFQDFSGAKQRSMNSPGSQHGGLMIASDMRVGHG